MEDGEKEIVEGIMGSSSRKRERRGEERGMGAAAMQDEGH